MEHEGEVPKAPKDIFLTVDFMLILKVSNTTHGHVCRCNYRDGLTRLLHRKHTTTEELYIYMKISTIVH